ncbi:hypothetical protein ACFLZM_06745 [Thermodesulfobacteriota bacterium]
MTKQMEARNLTENIYKNEIDKEGFLPRSGLLEPSFWSRPKKLAAQNNRSATKWE